MASGEACSKTRETLERKRELKHEYAAIIMLGVRAEVTVVKNGFLKCCFKVLLLYFLEATL